MTKEKQNTEWFMKFVQFFLGLAIGLLSLYYNSTQWHQTQIETLYELKELRREYQKIEEKLTKLTTILNKHEKDNARNEVKFNILEDRIIKIEKYIHSK